MEYLRELSKIHDRVKTIKEKMFSLVDIDPYSLVSPSAYDTAWLAMIPDSHERFKPMFGNCLNWILNNQNQHYGFWGDCDVHGMPTIECLTATLACVVALNSTGGILAMINKGLAYIHSSNAEKLLKEIKDQCPRWFAIVFPAMVELSQEIGLKIEINEALLSDIFYQRQRILDKEELVKDYQYPPLLSYFEALPSSYDVEQEDILNHLSCDGSLFQSPSATACAFMAYGNTACLSYLQAMVQKCPHGVPNTYPIDEELIRLSVINHVQRSGLAEHFTRETKQVLEQVYKNYMIGNISELGKKSYYSAQVIQLQLLKDSLAFRLLRMQGYQILPWNFCWFLYNEEVRNIIEYNHEYFSSVMLNVYRATDLAFPGEHDLEETRSFSRKLLEKSVSLGAGDQIPLRRLIEDELRFQWMARLDHLEHRMWIEESEINVMWAGKASFQRLSSLHNDKLVRLAMENYKFRQAIYKTELDQLKRWSKDWGLNDMGFGREKTTYCYFAIAASCNLPCDSYIRMIVAKSAIIITVADDFFDTKGTPTELRSLTDAVQKWDSKGLCSDAKTIFLALDNLVSEMATKYLKQEGSDITSSLRNIWYETFLSWLTESEWSRSDNVPSMEEYLQVGMKSIAIHTLVLPASCYLKPSLPNSKLRPRQYESVTELVMTILRLLNDLQSFEKEKDEGAPNAVLLYLKNNPHEVNIEEAISYVRDILNKKKEVFLEQVLMGGLTDLPRECRLLHLSCLKVFQMFFNSSNRYDSETEMLDDISKAIYIPPHVQCLEDHRSPIKPLSLPNLETKTKRTSIVRYGSDDEPYKQLVIRSSLPMNDLLRTTSSRDQYCKMTVAPKFSFCGFI